LALKIRKRKPCAGWTISLKDAHIEFEEKQC